MGSYAYIIVLEVVPQLEWDMVGPWGLLFVSVKLYGFSWSLALDAAFVFIVTSGGI